MIFLLAAVQASFDPREVWDKVEWAEPSTECRRGRQSAEATS